MYTPSAYAETDLSQLDALAAANPFITLVTLHGGQPFAAHLPVLYRREGDVVVLEGHWARQNPQAQDGATAALAIVHGPDAYVSPSWYPDKLEMARVPTWNYAVAHLDGQLERYEDEAALGDLVARMAERFEATVGGDWRYDHAQDDQRRQLRGIIGFRFTSTRAQLTFKLGQSHPAANRRAVMSALERGRDPDGQAVAALMRHREPPQED